MVSNFIVQALKGEDITIYGDGTQTRSFCYVDDLVNGIVRFMKTEGHTGPVNLGNDGEFTVQELAKEVIRLTESQSRVVNQPLPQDDPTRRRPDLSLARKLFGYEITAPLEAGLKRTIDYFRHL